MKTIKVKFFCNAGYTEEEVEIEILDGLTELEEENIIQEEFLHWLDNNEQCGWEIITD